MYSQLPKTLLANKGRGGGGECEDSTVRQQALRTGSHPRPVGWGQTITICQGLSNS